MLWTNVRAGSIPAPTTKQLNPFILRGFFVFVNIYLYISGMKNPLKDITKEKLTELLAKTDIPQSWPLDKIINKKNSESSKKNNK